MPESATYEVVTVTLPASVARRLASHDHRETFIDEFVPTDDWECLRRNVREAAGIFTWEVRRTLNDNGWVVGRREAYGQLTELAALFYDRTPAAELRSHALAAELNQAGSA